MTSLVSRIAIRVWWLWLFHRWFAHDVHSILINSTAFLECKIERPNHHPVSARSILNSQPTSINNQNTSKHFSSTHRDMILQPTTQPTVHSTLHNPVKQTNSPSFSAHHYLETTYPLGLPLSPCSTIPGWSSPWGSLMLRDIDIDSKPAYYRLCVWRTFFNNIAKRQRKYPKPSDFHLPRCVWAAILLLYFVDVLKAASPPLHLP